MHCDTRSDDSNNYVDILQKHRVFNIEETNENDQCSSLVPGTVIERDRSVKKIKSIHSTESRPLSGHGHQVIKT